MNSPQAGSRIALFEFPRSAMGLCPRGKSHQAYRNKKLYDPHGLRTVTKNLSIPILTLEVSHRPTLVIPTGAPKERSGGICSRFLTRNLYRGQSIHHGNAGRWMKNKLCIRCRCVGLAVAKRKSSFRAIRLGDAHGMDNPVGTHAEDDLRHLVFHSLWHTGEFQSVGRGGER